MRTSLLSRSVVALATLGISSAALAAVPASAASPAAVTRQQVLAVMDAFRNEAAGNWDDLEGLKSAQRALFGITSTVCGVQIDAEQYDYYRGEARPILAKQAEGLLVSIDVSQFSDDQSAGYRLCSFAVLAASEDGATLGGQATIGYVPVPPAPPTPPGEEDPSEQPAPVAPPAPVTTTLSGDVFTAPVLNFSSEDQFDWIGVSFAADGTATTKTPALVTKKVWDKKSTSEKKAAKKKYVKRLKAAKATYKRALGKAKGDTSKKAAAKQAYRKQRADATTKYKYAIWNYRYVKVSDTRTDIRPFTVRARTGGNPT